jgi:hypothetical protein
VPQERDHLEDIAVDVRIILKCFPSYEVGSGALSPGVKRLGHEDDHSPPSRAEVKNAWIYTFTPPYVSMVWFLIKHRIHHGMVLS